MINEPILSFQNVGNNTKDALQFLVDYDTDNLIPYTADHIRYIHDKYVIAKYGGAMGVRDIGLLESVASAPYQGFGSYDLYPSVVDKAAKYMFDFANYQIFVDGNKRTALALASIFLNDNGYSIDSMPAFSQYQLVMDIANHKINSVEEVVAVLNPYVSLYRRTYVEQEFETSSSTSQMEDRS